MHCHDCLLHHVDLEILVQWRKRFRSDLATKKNPKFTLWLNETSPERRLLQSTYVQNMIEKNQTTRET